MFVYSRLTKWRLADKFYKWGLPSLTQFLELQQGRDVKNWRQHKMGLMLPNYFLDWGSQRASSDDEGLWIFSDAAAAATLSFFSWAGGNSDILRGTGKKILFSFARSSCILRIVLFWDAPPERAQWWWCQGTSASEKQTNWNQGNLDAQKIRQKSWLDYPLVARPILAPDSEYELISEDLLPGNYKRWSDEQLIWVKIAPLYCFFVRLAVALSQDIAHT